MDPTKSSSERILRAPADDDGDTSGGGGGEDTVAGGGGDDVAAQIEAATSGLVANNKKLLSQHKASQQATREMQEKFDAVGGADGIQRLTELNERLQKDDLGKLLAEGKTDEWFDQRTTALRKEHESQIAGFQEQLTASDTERDEAVNERNNTLIAVKCTKDSLSAGVETDHMEDVSLWVERLFTWSTEHKQPVILDDSGVPKFGKDATTPMGIQEWIESQKETRRHWFPASQGGGATGGGKGTTTSGGDGYKNLSPKEFRAKWEADHKK